MRIIATIALLAVSVSAAAQTKLFLRASSSAGFPAVGVDTAKDSVGYGCNNLTAPQQLRRASATAGPGVLTAVTTPSSTAPPCQLASSTNYISFYSDPLASGVTISGNIDFNISCSESSSALNAGMRMIVKRWNARTGGIAETVITSADTAECSGTRLAIAAAAPASTVFSAGDRLFFILEIRNVGGAWGGNSSRTVTMSLDAASGSTGDTFANFADTLTFSSDTNNNPAKAFGQ